MENYEKGPHTVYKLHYHFVFVTKYRKPVLRGEVGLRARDMMRQICDRQGVHVLQGHVRPDHVHLMLSLPPQLAPSKVMQAIKGRVSHHLLREYRSLHREFWGGHLFARGYFVTTTGNVTDEMIKAYIAEQDAKPQNDPDFRVTE